MEYSGLVVKQQTVQTVELSNGSVPYANAVGPQRSTSVAVPDGGSTLLFIMAALTAIGWAATKRYWSRTGSTSAARITG
jgi:hypothetical protein